MKDLAKIKLNVLGAVLEQKEGLFSKKISPFCKVTYGKAIYETEIQKHFAENPGWEKG